MEYRKVPLTISQQVELLAERGLHMADKAEVRMHLQRIGYYRLTGYLRPFRIQGSDRFVDGATFTDGVKLYEFDQELRGLVLEAIGHIEVSVRAALTCEMAHAHGTFGHYEAQSFGAGAAWHAAWADGLTSEVTRARETFLDHFRATYSGYPFVPIWMATEVMSMGSISKMYRGMRGMDQKRVARRFEQPAPVFVSWLHAVAVARNICAHHGRLWNRSLSVKPMRPRSALWSDRQDSLPNDRLFFLLVVLRNLLHATTANVDSWSQRTNRALIPVLTGARMRTAAGAPADWIDHRLWYSSR